MNPIIAICDFTAYPALKAEKLFLEQKLESIQQEKRDLYHPSAIQYDSESGHNQNSKGIDKILISLITEEQKAAEKLLVVNIRLEETEKLVFSLTTPERDYVEEKSISPEARGKKWRKSFSALEELSTTISVRR